MISPFLAIFRDIHVGNGGILREWREAACKAVEQAIDFMLQQGKRILLPAGNAAIPGYGMTGFAVMIASVSEYMLRRYFCRIGQVGVEQSQGPSGRRA